jgi:hypothetical protein
MAARYVVFPANFENVIGRVRHNRMLIISRMIPKTPISSPLLSDPLIALAIELRSRHGDGTFESIGQNETKAGMALLEGFDYAV